MTPVRELGSQASIAETPSYARGFANTWKLTYKD
jgi:hypothetical protein